MIRQKQTLRHDPDNGVIGDCYRTAIACLLEVEPTEVPHFYEDLGVERDLTPDEYQAPVRWLREMGFDLIEAYFDGDDIEVDDILAHQAVVNPGRYYILSGKSRNQVNHVVICRDDGIVWDPALDDSGIIGPQNSGYYCVQWLVRVGPHLGAGL